jgi:hypothetical protein
VVPAVQPPVRKGFDSTLLERGLTDGASGSANVEYRPSTARPEYGAFSASRRTETQTILVVSFCS